MSPVFFCAAAAAAQTAKPPLTLDEFFNAVDIHSVRMSPDGYAVAINTARADWEADRFRTDLWLVNVRREARHRLREGVVLHGAGPGPAQRGVEIARLLA